MNYKIVLNIIGKTMLICALLLAFPLLVGFIYQENEWVSFVVPMAFLAIVGFIFSIIKPDRKNIRAREGFVIVALTWIVISAVGCTPYMIAGYIPNFFDAFFESVSGFTTTGASILSDVEFLSKGMSFWRMFTHWIGGMGVLVFVLAILPGYNEGVMHVFRAESPGPSVSKLVSKISYTARILYTIYFVMTLMEIIALLLSGMSFYDSVVFSFSTAGTGGFSIKNDGVASYSVASQMIMAVFMFLFGINFNVYYLITLRQIGKAFKNEELRVYLIIVAIATLTITLDVFFSALTLYDNFGVALKDSFFQVTSIISTTGLTSTNYDLTFTTLSKSILVFLTILGASAGSTGGGIKVSRFVILIKSTFIDVKKQLHPRLIETVKLDNQPLANNTVSNVKTFFIAWLLLVLATVIILSLDAFGNLFSNFSATLACIGNVGPGFDLVGPACNYGGYSAFSKLWLSLVMLAGRLEIFPMILLFLPNTWKKY